MSTRAVYSFYDDISEDGVHAYVHHDGYPAGAAKRIEAAKALAWGLPRFEADEFGASFVAANKTGPGSVRLTPGPDHHGDLAYRYEIRFDSVKKDLEVTAFDTYTGQQIYQGGLAGLAEAEE